MSIRKINRTSEQNNDHKGKFWRLVDKKYYGTDSMLHVHGREVARKKRDNRRKQARQLKLATR